jgi:uncharacterized protein
MTKAFPSIAICLGFFDEFEMLDNIRAHSVLVAQVATSLIDSLTAAGKSPGPLPNRQEAMAGALLHDIAKTMCIKTGCHHAEVGQQICLELGYPEIGEIVAEHVVLKNFPVDLYQQGVFTAKEMVFYADKRVLHDQVVPLSNRLDYILKRYGQGNPLKEQFIHLNFQRTIDLERYLFGFLDFSPEEMFDYLVAIPGLLPAPAGK